MQVGDLMTFPNRNAMVNDLTKNYNLKGKSLGNVTSLLGQPQFPLNNTMEMGYKIDEDFGSDIDPIYTKKLLFQFNKDTLVNSFKVEEWKK